MDYNNIIIFLIFCLTLSLIYISYIKFENKYTFQDKIKKKQIDNFYINDLEIKKYNEKLSIINDKNGFINELIMPKKKINDSFDYLTIPIETIEDPVKLGEELIKKKKETNLSKLNSLYNNNNKDNTIITYEINKKPSTDLPIANLHSRFLLNNKNNNTIKLSNLINL
tara:strand:+ start:2366 stop:2869 length:504 start_codon:yes stop_codon:yes gene_type:complete